MNTEKIIEDQVELYVLEQQMPLTYADPLRNALRRAVDQAIQQEREACAKVCEAHISVYLKDGERWLKGKKGQPDTRMKDLAPHLEAAWEAEQLLKNKSGVEWITQAHKFAAAIRARGNE